jgi:hypothetical protein
MKDDDNQRDDQQQMDKVPGNMEGKPPPTRATKKSDYQKHVRGSFFPVSTVYF